jgi:hypothetical protein
MNNIEIEIESMASGVLWVREKRVSGFYRYCVLPGDDTSSRPPEVQEVAGRLHTPKVIAAYRSSLLLDPDEIQPPAPDWEGLVAAVMANDEFKAAWVAAAAIDPPIGWSLSTAFGMVGQGHPGNFINLFNAICALAEVSPEQRGIWADIGGAYNAPAEFLDIVRGVGNGE